MAGPPPGIGFGSTYEGLKQLVLRHTVSRGKRFGSTYEGLKPSVEEAAVTVLDVFWQYL